jgi:secreted trypsin-like serine protease
MDNEERGAKAHRVHTIMIHENWDFESNSFDGDVALLLLDGNVDLSDRYSVGIVCLPSSSSGPVIGNGTVAGWGVSEWATANTKGHSITPNDLELPAVTNEECTNANVRFFELISNRIFCAGFVNQGKAACKGDSGGGFLQYDITARRFNLAGIVSGTLYNSMNECEINTYSVFNDVRKFVDWINEGVEKTKDLRWQKVEFQCEMRKTYG